MFLSTDKCHSDIPQSVNGSYQVFLCNGYVYKLYDKQTCLKPNLKLLLKSLILGRCHLNSTGRYKYLRYKYVEGCHECKDKKGFVTVAQIHLKIHKHGYVHSDIREANIVFGDCHAWIIDFDLANQQGTNTLTITVTKVYPRNARMGT